MTLIANGAWHSLVQKVLKTGDESSPRGLKTLELLGEKTCVNMNFPVVVSKERKLGYRFMVAEAAWILSGDNRVETIKPFSKEIGQFSDDGIFYYGAYGPQFRDQIRHVLDALVKDSNTRQAVVTLWRPNPPKTKDTPCTISLHWMIRDNELHCFADMRSSDVWLGVPYDWFNFTMASGYLALLYRELTGVALGLGTLHFYAHSQHLYDTNALIASNLDQHQRRFNPPEFEWQKFGSHTALVAHLWSLANGIKTPFDFMYNEMHGGVNEATA